MSTTRRVLVLGSQGGIGQALIPRLAGSGWTVLEGVHGDPATAGPLAVEAMTEGSVEQAVQHAAEEGELDAVVNLIGSLKLTPPQRLETRDFLDTFRVHAGSCFEVVRAATQSVKKGGALVFVSSAAAHLGLSNHEAIAAAKAGVEGLTRGAAASLSGRGVRVNAVAPGLVETPLTSALTSNDGVRRASEKMHALGRIGQPADIARAIEFLLDSEWMTGEVLRVDGGLSQVRSPRG